MVRWSDVSGLKSQRDVLAAKFGAILPRLDERQRRLLIGAEARSLGPGGIRAVARAAGVREATVSAGIRELGSGEVPLGRTRQPGGGRKRVDVAANTGWVNVGTDHDTAAFAVESIRRWWNGAGQAAYPTAGRLLIIADAGRSNGYRTRDSRHGRCHGSGSRAEGTSRGFRCG